MFLTVAARGTYHFGCFLIYYYLALNRMTFFLARIKLLLLIITILYSSFVTYFFLGRSIGDSAASTKIISYSILPFKSSFFPGKENLLFFISMSSTHLQAL